MTRRQTRIARGSYISMSLGLVSLADPCSLKYDKYPSQVVGRRQAKLIPRGIHKYVTRVSVRSQHPYSLKYDEDFSTASSPYQTNPS